MLGKIQADIKAHADPQKAKLLAGFFKTGKGQYGEGDVFYGLMVPVSRFIAKKYPQLPLTDIADLLGSKIHEERLISLLILVSQFEKGDDVIRKKLFSFYLAHTRQINNWDLVDLTASRIVGAYLYPKIDPLFLKLAHSENLWEKRISIISTLFYICQKKYEPTLTISKVLLSDSHDLIHKAVGWMLREVGKHCEKGVLEKFLDEHIHDLPRTTLRYAIERFPEQKRQHYLQLDKK